METAIATVLWCYNHSTIVLAGFMVAEKLVLLSKWKWDDIVVSGTKEVYKYIVKK
jgi:hypothetical protein